MNTKHITWKDVTDTDGQRMAWQNTPASRLKVEEECNAT